LAFAAVGNAFQALGPRRGRRLGYQQLSGEDHKHEHGCHLERGAGVAAHCDRSSELNFWSEWPAGAMDRDQQTINQTLQEIRIEIDI
jgi:hypothetical protein